MRLSTAGARVIWAGALGTALIRKEGLRLSSTPYSLISPVCALGTALIRKEGLRHARSSHRLELAVGLGTALIRKEGLRQTTSGRLAGDRLA